MLRKNIKFENIDGETVESTFYFNLTKAEVIELGLVSKAEDLDDYFQDIVRRKDTQALIDLFKDIIKRSVGQRHTDGMLFVKDPLYTQAFVSSDAYSELFMSLFTDADGTAMQEFMVGILPSSMTKELTSISAEDLKAVAEGVKTTSEVTGVTPLTTRSDHLQDTSDKVFEQPAEPKNYSRDELLAMSDDEFIKTVGGGDVTKMDPKHLTIAFERKNRAMVAADPAHNPQS